MSTKNIIIDTGNVFSFDVIKALQNANEEVLEGISNILKAYCTHKCEAKDVKVLDKDVTFVSSGQELAQDYDRKQLKLSVKLFVYPEALQDSNESKKALIDDAVTSILQLLSVSHLDNLILSIQESQVDQIVPVLKPLWAASEVYMEADAGKKVHELGTSDLNRDQLRELFEAAKIKPSSSQINLDACCDIPEELSTFSKQNGIKLLTHNDPLADFVPVERIRTLLDSLKSGDQTCKLLEQIIPSGSAGLARKWIARYTMVLSGQGVLLSKGYLVSLSSQDSAPN